MLVVDQQMRQKRLARLASPAQTEGEGSPAGTAGVEEMKQSPPQPPVGRASSDTSAMSISTTPGRSTPSKVIAEESRPPQPPKATPKPSPAKAAPSPSGSTPVSDDAPLRRIATDGDTLALRYIHKAIQKVLLVTRDAKVRGGLHKGIGTPRLCTRTGCLAE
jgi:hypothetical protein